MKPLPSDKLSSLLPPVRKYRFVSELPYEYFENSAAYPFESSAKEFRLVNAWWLMEAAMLAYSDSRITEHWCRRAGFKDIDWFSEGGTQCFIAAREEYIFVVFRGTDTPTRLLNFFIDWRINFRLGLVPFDNEPGCVHRGFLKALNRVSKRTSSASDIDLQSRLESISAKYPQATVWFTGHSQGATLATLAAIRHVRRGGSTQVYTFGSPRLGDQKFQESFNVPAWRVVNSTDIITRLPKLGIYSRSSGLFRWPILGVYRPAGELRFIDDNGEIGPEEVKVRRRFRLVTFVQQRIRRFFGRFTNHAPIDYAVRISNAMVNEQTNTFPVLSSGEPVKRWRWWEWALVLTPLVVIFGGAIIFGIRYWFAPAREDPEAAIILENGLGSDREEFYTLAEGSEMFPLAIAESIRLPKDEIQNLKVGEPSGFFAGLLSVVKGGRTRLVDNLEEFGFIKVPITPANPLGYIGLTISRREGTGVEMLGVNCAACHVGQMEYRKPRQDGNQAEAEDNPPIKIRIDGAPNQLDVFGFVEALSNSSKFYNLNGIVFAKNFALRIKEINPRAWSVYKHQVSQHNKLKTNPKPLNGRADAFGTARAMFFGDFRELSSPASYPHIWGLQNTLWYHWNANTNSILQRNVGQALGLGAGIDPKTCKTTIQFDALDRLERLASKLTAPSWPAEFDQIDEKLRALGEKIYAGDKPYEVSGNCARCHDNYTTVTEQGVDRHDYRLSSLNEVGTDPNEARNFVPSVMVDKTICQGNTGVMEPMHFDKAHEVLLGRIRYETAVDKVADLNHYVNGAREKPKWKVRQACGKGDDCPVYPAKPLVGIWATAPYLHNGSVPSIWDLLTAPDKRPREFEVGRRRYDPEKLGYVTEAQPDETPEEKKKRYPVFKTNEPGNLNTGHDFGTTLMEDDKRALIEYIKSMKEGDQEKLRKVVKPEKD